MAPVNPGAAVADKAIPLCANDIGHLQRWPTHFFRSLREAWTSSRLESRSYRGNWEPPAGVGGTTRGSVRRASGFVQIALSQRVVGLPMTK